MKKILVITFVSLSGLAYGFTDSHIKKLKKLPEIKPIDLVHEHKGCPENSKCSKTNGMKRSNWQAALRKYSESDKVQDLNSFIETHGHPTTFLINENKSKALDPIIFSSKCSFHKKQNIVEGTLFLKRRPKNKNIVLNDIKIEKQNFTLPYNTSVIGIKNKKPLVMYGEDGVFYTIQFDSNMQAKAISLSSEELEKLLQEKEKSNCKRKIENKEYYTQLSCYKVLDLDAKKLKSVTQNWSCN